MTAPNASAVGWLVLTPLIGWGAYRRIRRGVGRQRFSIRRVRATLVVYAVLLVVVGLAGWGNPGQATWLAVGFGAGLLLGWIGLRQTRFRVGREACWYTPRAHFGIGLSALFLARVGYRLSQTLAVDRSAGTATGGTGGGALTTGVFGLLAGYYVLYALGLALWARRVERARCDRRARKPRDRRDREIALLANQGTDHRVCNGVRVATVAETPGDRSGMSIDVADMNSRAASSGTSQQSSIDGPVGPAVERTHVR